MGRRQPRWRVDVFFRSPSHPEPILVESKAFRFRFMARFFAWENDQWSGWRSTQPQIVDQWK